MHLLCGDGGCHKRHKLEAEVASGILVVLDPGTHHPTHSACEKLSSCTIIESASLSMSTRQSATILPNDWALDFGRSEGSWEGVAGPAGPQGLLGRSNPQSVSLPPPE